MTPSIEYQKFTREAKAQLVSVFKYDREHDIPTCQRRGAELSSKVITKFEPY